MQKLDLFIPQEMLTAPEHPLANNMESPLSNPQQSATEEIWAIQQRDRIPGVVKRIIPIDNESFWEYWWCVPGRFLLPEDMELLQRDRPRIEEILNRLVLLWGGICFGEDTNRNQDHELIHNWQQILAFALQRGMKPDFLDIDFLPLTIKQEKQPSNAASNSSPINQVFVEPAHWHIEFFQIQPIVGGFVLQEPKKICSCQVWTGKPFIKHLDTGKTTTCYDLWVSRPLDLTIPPWQTHLTAKES